MDPAPERHTVVQSRISSSRPLAQTLRREKRIKRGGDFLRARETGRRVVNGCLVFNWRETGPDHATRVGIITTRKLGGAVIRSRARRLLREAFRLNQHELMRPIDLVLVARSSIVAKKLCDVEGDFRAAAQRAGLIERGMPSAERGMEKTETKMKKAPSADQNG